ncbi:hypothetical protein BCP01_070 [Bacillus phage BCP01]|nr:hypothetical protein BCP01_070 [Bacillus phage BCP01]
MTTGTAQSGDVIFYKPTGFIGRVISRVTKSPYSHVALALNSDTMIEADRFVNTRITAIAYDSEITHVYRLENVTQEERDRIVTNALKLEGSKYDYAQIAELFIRLVLGIKRTLFNNKKKLTCSEVVDKSFYESGINRKDVDNLYDITPEELLHKYSLHRVL